MKAAVYDRFGPPEVVSIREVPTPVPGDGEILVRMRAASVSIGDSRTRSLRVPRGFALPVRFALGFKRPKKPILGFDLAGEVVAVGKKVTRFRVGDRVAASTGFAGGCHAEYRALAEDGTVARIPDSVTYETAAALPFGAGTALYFLRRGKLRSGEAILINGASGAVGSAAVQLARHMGAEVTAVTSGRNADLVRALGADHVIDYAREDFTRDGRRYDVIMEAVGNAPYARVKSMLRPGGRLLQVIADLPETIGGMFRKNVIGSGVSGSDLVNAAALQELLDLAERGILTPVVDRTWPLDEIVAAHAYVDTGRKRGTVLVTA